MRLKRAGTFSEPGIKQSAAAAFGHLRTNMFSGEKMHKESHHAVATAGPGALAAADTGG